MDLHRSVELEWRDDHALSRRSLIWICDHAEPGDLQPIVTAIAQLRAAEVGVVCPHQPATIPPELSPAGTPRTASLPPTPAA